ncbi:reverse transcriptase domain-containing protein [Tanacetum coccineum]
MMASFFQMNTASTLGTGSLPSNTIANPKGELKSITTRSGLVLDGPTVPMPPPFINPEEMLKSLLSNKEKLIELANIPLNENCSAVILKKLLEKLGDPGKFLIPCGFNELKYKALADLGASMNLIPLSVWKELGLPELISTQMTLELANRDICTPKGIARDFFVPVGKSTFPDDFVIVDYEAIRDYLLNHDLIKEMDSILEDSIDENSLDDTISEMFTDEHALDYSSPPLCDDYDDNLFDLETINDDTYDDPFDFKEEKIKESKLLIDELDLPRSSDFLPFPECDSVFYEDFSEVDALPSTDNEDKIFNPEATNASLILEDFNPTLLYELPRPQRSPGFGALLLFSSENEEKVFTPGILTSKRVHTSLLPKLSHRGTKAFKVTKILGSPMKIFPFSYQEDIRVLDVSCLHFYPLAKLIGLGDGGQAK